MQSIVIIRKYDHFWNPKVERQIYDIDIYESTESNISNKSFKNPSLNKNWFENYLSCIALLLNSMIKNSQVCDEMRTGTTTSFYYKKLSDKRIAMRRKKGWNEF